MTGPNRRFWFEFELGLDEPCPRGVRAGVGATAESEEAARDLVASRVFGGVLPPVRTVVADVRQEQLCPWLVLPNMHDWMHPGVWFPVGFQTIRRRRSVSTS